MTEILDMSQFTEAKSDQLNADDLIGSPRTVTITKVVGTGGDQPVSIHYQGDNGKPFKPCKTIRRVLIGVWGKYANEYIGKSMTLYRDDKVTFGGLETGGIRISHMSHIDKETVVVVMKTKGKKAGIRILPLKVEQSQQPKKKTPAEWVAEYEAGLEECADLAALQAYQSDEHRARWVVALKDRNASLHKRVIDANAKRYAELSEPEGGRTDSDFGDPFDGSEQGE